MPPRPWLTVYSITNRQAEHDIRRKTRVLEEGDFADLVAQMKPHKATFKVAKTMLNKLWDRMSLQADNRAQAFRKQIDDLDKKVDLLVDRLADADSDHVAKACSKKINEMKSRKALLAEKANRTGKKQMTVPTQ